LTVIGPPRPRIQTQLYTAHTVISGLIELQHNRLSDHLNFGPPLLELAPATLRRLTQPALHQAETMALVRRDTVLLAVDRLSTGYQAGEPELREPKAALQVTADLGHFVVAGTLYLTSGLALTDWLGDGPLFVPLTRVTILGEVDQLHEPFAVINRLALTALLV
jgi:hypothetical protein